VRDLLDCDVEGHEVTDTHLLANIDAFDFGFLQERAPRVFDVVDVVKQTLGEALD
jgi:hypothetical protein